MKHRLLAVFSVILLSLFSQVNAAGGGIVSIPEVKPAPQPLGDAARGEAKSVTCVACHGEQGNSIIPGFPKLAGQSAVYAYKQLKDMKRPAEDPSARPVPEMMGILETLTDQDMRDLASYYALQTTTVEGADPDLVDLGEKIYRSGKKDARVAACASCHGIQGKGMPHAGMPALGGQHAQYLADQLRAFRAAGREDIGATKYRRNDENMMMRKAVKGLSDKEIQAVASYISGLH